MVEIIKHTGAGAFLLIIVPLVVWATGWHWVPNGDSYLQYALYWFTESVTRPWGILTSALLCCWFLWCLRLRFIPALFLLAIITTVITGGQFINKSIKILVKEPRPYVLWLNDSYHIDSKYFYARSRGARWVLVTELIDNDKRIPTWLKRHWAYETGYSFPSGHSLFATSWALLSVGLLWSRRQYKTIAVVMIWAAGVMTSRLVLGMHWPRDLIAAVLLSWLLVILSIWSVQRWTGVLGIKPHDKMPNGSEN